MDRHSRKTVGDLGDCCYVVTGLKIQAATLADREACLHITEAHPDTKAFSNPHFSGRQAFDQGMVGLARLDRRSVGLICVRHCIRKPKSSVYFLAVDPDFRRRGIGQALVHWALRRSPHGRLVLLCNEDNVVAMAFYRAVGFVIQRAATEKGKQELVLNTNKLNRER